MPPLDQLREAGQVPLNGKAAVSRDELLAAVVGSAGGYITSSM
jgi:hypothetical protein